MATYDPNDPMDAWFFNKTGSKLQKISNTYGAPLSGIQQYVADVRNAGVSYGAGLGGGSSVQSGNYAMGGGGGGLDALAKQLMDQLTAAQAEAKAANEKRYSEILGLYDKRYGEVLGKLEGMGTQARADIEQRGKERMANTMQQMAGRGLLGSTLAATVPAVTNRETEAEYGRLEESVRQRTVDLMDRMQKEKMDFMERRTDTGPDMGMYAQLLDKLGVAEGGQAEQGSLAASSYGGAQVTYGGAYGAAGEGFQLAGGATRLQAPGPTTWLGVSAPDYPRAKKSATSLKAKPTDYKSIWTKPKSTGGTIGNQPLSWAAQKYLGNKPGIYDATTLYKYR